MSQFTFWISPFAQRHRYVYSQYASFPLLLFQSNIN